MVRPFPMRRALLPCCQGLTLSEDEPNTSPNKLSIRMANDTKVTNDPVLAKELKDLLSKSIEGNLQLLTRVSGMVREGARVLRASSARPQQPGEIVSRLVRLNLSYFSLLTKHGLAFADELTTITERALGIKPDAGAAASPPRVEINLQARVGDTASAAFLVENSQQQTLEVSFEASQIVSRQGEPIRSPAVRFDPPRVTLKPHLQATVRALIDISPEFKPGELYLLRIRLVGFEQKEVWIGINVLPRAQETPKPKAQSSKKKARQKKRK